MPEPSESGSISTKHTAGTSEVYSKFLQKKNMNSETVRTIYEYVAKYLHHGMLKNDQEQDFSYETFLVHKGKYVMLSASATLDFAII